MENKALIMMDEAECCLVMGGGVDKNAQKALYYVGYAIGVMVKIFGGMFTGCDRKVESV